MDVTASVEHRDPIRILDIGALSSGDLVAVTGDGALWILRKSEVEGWATWRHRRFVYWLPQPGRLVALGDLAVWFSQGRDPISFRNGRAWRCDWLSAVTRGDDLLSYAHVVYGGRKELLCVSRSGDLLRVKHSETSGASTQELGEGWHHFVELFGNDGVLFAVGPTGELLVLDHSRQCQEAETYNRRPVPLGSGGWNGFRLLSGGQGVHVIALGVDGSLKRFDFGAGARVANYGAEPRCIEIGNGWPSSELEAYCWPQSVGAGDRLSVFVSNRLQCNVKILDLRRGEYDSGRFDAPRLVEPTIQHTQSGSSMAGAGWAATIELSPRYGCRSGIYSVVLDDGTSRAHAVFVVRPSTARAPIMALASTNTWNAYNSWGGGSKYGPTFPRLLASQRPNPACTPEWDGRINHLLAADVWAMQWLSGAGYQFEVASDVDIHQGRINLSAYAVLLLMTHPEYWTVPMRDQVDAYLRSGGSIVYLGGNGLFEVCDLSDDGSSMAVFMGCDGSDRLPMLFRNLSPPRPERELLGVGFRFDTDWKADPAFHNATAYRVVAGDHFVFAGTGLRSGDLVGSVGRNGGGANGWEMDTSESGRVDGSAIVTARGTDDRGRAPDNLELLARGVPVDESRYSGDMTIYETGAGGYVFSAGSLCFTGSLVEDRLLQRIVCNVLDACLIARGNESARE